MTDDFQLFNKLSFEFFTKSTISSAKKECIHPECVFENGLNLCVCCGEEICRTITHDREWHFYGNDKKNSDPNRVHVRKNEEKTIDADVQNMNVSQSVVSKANELYSICTNGSIYRGSSRKSIIFACIFYAYKMTNKPQSPDSLIKLFGLTRKAGLRGLKIVTVNIPKTFNLYEPTDSSFNLINDIMNRFLTTEEQRKQVFDIYNDIKNRSSKLNRARPQSVATAVIYYWIVKNNIAISLDEFSHSTNLSALTIIKNVKEVEKVFSTNKV